MSARDQAVFRDRVARLTLARGGVVLPETDRRRGAHAGVGPSSIPEGPAVGVLTAEDLTVAERSIFDRLMVSVRDASATVDLVDHVAHVARNNARVKRCAPGGAR